MKQGERIPPQIREFIVTTRLTNPGLSYSKIASMTQSEHDVAIDRSSVRRICQQHQQLLEETGQPITKAREYHLGDISDLLHVWQRELAKQIELGEAGLIDTSPSDVEAKRLFPATLEHCPSIRNTYDELAKRRHMYEERWAELETEIRQTAPPEATEYFSKTAVLYAVSVARGDTVPSYNNKNKNRLDVKVQRKVIAQGSAKARKQVKGQHLSLIEHYSQDRRVLEMVSVQKAILEQQHQLDNTLEGSILRHEHRTASVKCEFCPVRK